MSLPGGITGMDLIIPGAVTVAVAMAELLPSPVRQMWWQTAGRTMVPRPFLALMLVVCTVDALAESLVFGSALGTVLAVAGMAGLLWLRYRADQVTVTPPEPEPPPAGNHVP